MAQSPAGSRPSASAARGTGVQREGEVFPGTHGSEETSLVPDVRGSLPQVSSEGAGLRASLSTQRVRAAAGREEEPLGAPSPRPSAPPRGLPASLISGHEQASRVPGLRLSPRDGVSFTREGGRPWRGGVRRAGVPECTWPWMRSPRLGVRPHARVCIHRAGLWGLRSAVTTASPLGVTLQSGPVGLPHPAALSCALEARPASEGPCPRPPRAPRRCLRSQRGHKPLGLQPGWFSLRAAGSPRLLGTRKGAGVVGLLWKETPPKGKKCTPEAVGWGSEGDQTVIL